MLQEALNLNGKCKCCHHGMGLSTGFRGAEINISHGGGRSGPPPRPGGDRCGYQECRQPRRSKMFYRDEILSYADGDFSKEFSALGNL